MVANIDAVQRLALSLMPRILDEAMTHLGIFLAVLVLSLIVFVSYGYAPKITAHISAQTAHGLLRVISFGLLPCDRPANDARNLDSPGCR